MVPKGVEHKPYADREVRLMLIEPRGVRNTGGTLEASGRRKTTFGCDATGEVPRIMAVTPPIMFWPVH